MSCSAGFDADGANPIGFGAGAGASPCFGTEVLEGLAKPNPPPEGVCAGEGEDAAEGPNGNPPAVGFSAVGVGAAGVETEGVSAGFGLGPNENPPGAGVDADAGNAGTLNPPDAAEEADEVVNKGATKTGAAPKGLGFAGLFPLVLFSPTGKNDVCTLGGGGTPSPPSVALGTGAPLRCAGLW